MITDIPWTDEDRILWEKTLGEEHVKRALLKLQLECLPPTSKITEPGLDLKQIASQAHAFTQGQVSIFEKMQALKRKTAPAPLPKAFQAPKLPEPPDLND